MKNRHLSPESPRRATTFWTEHRPFVLSLSAGLLLVACSERPVQDQGESHTEAEVLLNRSIAYHDPAGAWWDETVRLELSSSRPDGSTREVTLRIENGRGVYESVTRQDGDTVAVSFEGETSQASLNGSQQISDQDREKHRLNPERMSFMRNYYLYLYGLPMKLRDAGTIIDPEVISTTFQGLAVEGIRVTYEKSVGQDIWYFYFDPASAALVGYRFYHDESKNDGEYITLEGEAEASGIRLPKVRKWYTHQEDKYLGVDTIESLQIGD